MTQAPTPTPTDLASGLRRKAEAWSMLGHPALIERFVLRNGQPYTALEPWEGDLKTPNQCFENAYFASREIPNSVYVEGFAMREDIGVEFHHAWIATPTGFMDPTLRDPERYQFLGIPFPGPVVSAEILRTGYYGLLCGVFVNHEFMFARDPGLEAETASITGKNFAL